jgi:L-asparaginase II
LSAGRVVVERGGLAESEHRFSWRLDDGSGGGEDEAVFLRSAAKPLQALPAVRAGVLDRLGLDDRHLAVACASHGGSPEHLARVAEVLAACGLGVDVLACGPLAPRDPVAALALSRPPRRIHHNCSGKHALGLALCVVEGWPLHGYQEAHHPLQRAMADAVARALGVPDPPQAIDGCGMRTYFAPLSALAAAFARLADGGLGDAGARVASAMRAHPTLVAYPGAIDTELMAAAPVVAKIGAEGILAVGRGDGRGLAVKVTDGSQRALDPAAVWAVREALGVDVRGAPIDALAAPAVVNSRGVPVGRLTVAAPDPPSQAG